MVNNYWEEKHMGGDILKFHEEELNKWGIPKWMNIKCPFCKEEIPVRSIRSIGIKFNTRNMGDIVLEFMCEKCSKLDTVYFHKQVEKISDFIPFLIGDKIPSTDPIVEEKMYKMQYNNVMEKMMNNAGAIKTQYNIKGDCK